MVLLRNISNVVCCHSDAQVQKTQSHLEMFIKLTLCFHLHFWRLSRLPLWTSGVGVSQAE